MATAHHGLSRFLAGIPLGPKQYLRRRSVELIWSVQRYQRKQRSVPHRSRYAHQVLRRSRPLRFVRHGGGGWPTVAGMPLDHPSSHSEAVTHDGKMARTTRLNPRGAIQVARAVAAADERPPRRRVAAISYYRG
jgi:hypothetical protein